uniref:Matrix metallopeptidase 20a (enamelysin) n=1 Tax=Sinocyclocheilus anshuiensis TaxID=1608454 RepID=A0A671N9U7_9TELE
MSYSFIEYLQRFYQLKMRSHSKRHADLMNLKESGLLDLKTQGVMREARCGVPDVENFSFYPGREAAALKFVQVKHGMVDITFSSNSKTHGDFFPFNGPGGVLRIVYGDVHFDDDETLTVGCGYNLFTVAAHELGHSSGLSHSRDPTALMHPKYKFLNAATYKLPRDDILGIQALYGKLPRKNKTKQHKTLVIPNKNWSQRAIIAPSMNLDFSETVKQIDAAVHVIEHGKTYFFTGDYYFSYDEKRSVLDHGFPRKVHMNWPGIVGKVDAAFELNGNGLYHFLPKRHLLHIMNTSAWFGCK